MTELEKLNLQLQNKTITQEQYDKAVQALDKDTADKRNELAQREFSTNKKLDIANVWMNAASSIAGWWQAAPKLGPIAGPIFAGFMTGATTSMAGLQTGLISQQQFVPSYAEGGTASGISRLNERGGEIVNLPDGTTIIPHDISQRISRSIGTERALTINMFEGAKIDKGVDIEALADKVSRRIAERIR